MELRTRKMLTARSLNSNGAPFGGRVLGSTDEQAFIRVSCRPEGGSIIDVPAASVAGQAGILF